VTYAAADMPKPSLRGRLHQIAFIVWIPAGITLVALGRTALARVAAAIYSVSVLALYGVSAAYHRLPWSPRARRWMRRLDHSTIFILIAGSYTPLGLLALHHAWRVSILATVWGVALVGILLKMIHLEKMDRIGMVLYIVLGWTALIALPEIMRSLGPAPIVLLFAGGILYTVGAIFFALHRPHLNPKVFGYHEMWHSMVIGGSVCHYAMILLLAVGAH
jgi:hemolysin III